VTVHVNPLFYK